MLSGAVPPKNCVKMSVVFYGVNCAWRVMCVVGVYTRVGGGVGGGGYLSALRDLLRGNGAALEPSHRRDEQEVPEAQARRGVEEGVVGAGLAFPAVDAVLRNTVPA